jgi:hypothetical protein
MERPFAVRAGIGAFMANLILGVISAIVAFASIDTLVAEALRAENVDVTISDDVLRSAVVAGYAVALVFVALQAMFIWFAWQGRNWARIVLWVLGGLSVVSGLASLGMATAPSTGFLTALSWFGFALAVAGIVLLAQKPANEWYRYRGWLRASRSVAGPQPGHPGRRRPRQQAADGGQGQHEQQQREHGHAAAHDRRQQVQHREQRRGRQAQPPCPGLTARDEPRREGEDQAQDQVGGQQQEDAALRLALADALFGGDPAGELLEHVQVHRRHEQEQAGEDRHHDDRDADRRRHRARTVGRCGTLGGCRRSGHGTSLTDPRTAAASARASGSGPAAEGRA